METNRYIRIKDRIKELEELTKGKTVQAVSRIKHEVSSLLSQLTRIGKKHSCYAIKLTYSTRETGIIILTDVTEEEANSYFELFVLPNSPTRTFEVIPLKPGELYDIKKIFESSSRKK